MTVSFVILKENGFFFFKKVKSQLKTIFQKRQAVQLL